MTKSMFVPKDKNTYKVYEQKNAIQKDATLGNYYITFEKFEELRGFEVFEKDIIVSCAGTIGETFVLPPNIENGIINQALMIVRLYLPEIKRYYLDYFDSVLKQTAAKDGKGTAIKNIPPFEVLKAYPFPLPPLKEQFRIANAIDTYFGLLEKVEQSKTKIIKYVSSVKSKILELAMQGKLVPQDPTDEPAAEMLKRINPNAKILTDFQHSWNIPSNWIWISVKDIFKPMERELPSGDEFKYIDIDSIDNKTNTAHPKTILTKAAPSRASRKTRKGDIVFSMVRPYLKNIAIVPEDDCIASTGFYVLSCTRSINHVFAFLIAISDFFVKGLNSFMKGDNSPSINKDHIENYVIPLPPLNEQKRIVAKIEELYSVLDKIEEAVS